MNRRFFISESFSNGFSHSTVDVWTVFVIFGKITCAGFSNIPGADLILDGASFGACSPKTETEAFFHRQTYHSFVRCDTGRGTIRFRIENFKFQNRKKCVPIFCFSDISVPFAEIVELFPIIFLCNNGSMSLFIKRVWTLENYIRRVEIRFPTRILLETAKKDLRRPSEKRVLSRAQPGPT